MRKLWTKFYLWCHGYCTKHIVPKEMSWNGYDIDTWCELCVEESARRHEARIAKAIQEVRQ